MITLVSIYFYPEATEVAGFCKQYQEVLLDLMGRHLQFDPWFLCRLATGPNPWATLVVADHKLGCWFMCYPKSTEDSISTLVGGNTWFAHIFI